MTSYAAADIRLAGVERACGQMRLGRWANVYTSIKLAPFEDEMCSADEASSCWCQLDASGLGGGGGGEGYSALVFLYPATRGGPSKRRAGSANAANKPASEQSTSTGRSLPVGCSRGTQAQWC